MRGRLTHKPTYKKKERMYKMKTMKKLLALIMALTMVFALAATGFAAESEYSITITDTKDDVIVAGHTFDIYRVFNVTYDNNDHYTYTFTDDIVAVENQFKITVDGVEYWGDRFTNPPTAEGDTSLLAYLENVDQTFDSAAMNDFAAKFLDWMIENNIEPEISYKMKTESDTVEVSAPGYFLITGSGEDANKETIVAGINLTTTHPNATVNLKLDATTIEKVATDHLLDDNALAAEREVGKSVPYTITTQVPNMTGCETFTLKVTDTMSKGLTFNDDLTIKVNGQTFVLKTEDNEDDALIYTVEHDTDNDGADVMTIDFPNIIKIDEKHYDKDITIEYTCTVNNNALEYNWEKNTATVSYGRDPDKLTESQPKTVYVYDVDIEVNKVDGEKKPLKDAWFVLRDKETQKYYKVTKGTGAENDKIEWVDLSAKNYTMNALTAEQLQELDGLVTIGKTAFDDPDDPTKALCSFTGLETGTYELVEVKAPDGYNILLDPVEVEITIKVNEDGYLIEEGTTVDNTNSGQLTLVAEIENSSGTLLPETGGMGTTLFYVIGSILVVGAAVLLISKKRMSV